MKKKYIVLLVISGLSIAYYAMKKTSEPTPDFFNTTFLRNSAAVEKVLHQLGFFEVEITTNDNLKVSATILDQSPTKQIQTTIISCPGFVPGSKEGMTTIYAMLKDHPYNFLFLDLRGHGKSQGELLTYSGIKHYGEFEFLDIVAAIEYVVQYNQEHHIKQHIVIHGLCSGAFHAIKAMNYLKIHNLDAYNSVKGIVFDSGWPSVSDIVETTLISESHKRCSELNLSFFSSFLSYCMVNFYTFFFKEHHDKQESISAAIGVIGQPILFIHGQDDTYIPIHHVHPLIEKSKKPTSWFIKESTHAAHHLKHQQAYKEQLEEFIQSVI